MTYERQGMFEVPKLTVSNYLIKQIGMLETYVNPKFRSEKTEIKTRMSDQFYFQVMDPEAFHKAVDKQKLKLSNNVYHKVFDLYAN